MSTPLLPEVVPEIDANPMSFYWGGGGCRLGLELGGLLLVINSNFGPTLHRF